jgi:hypothetical protein
MKHILKSLRSLSAAVIILGSLAGLANGALTVTITGVPGEGVSRLVFDGSSQPNSFTVLTTSSSNIDHLEVSWFGDNGESRPWSTNVVADGLDIIVNSVYRSGTVDVNGLINFDFTQLYLADDVIGADDFVWMIGPAGTGITVSGGDAINYNQYTRDFSIDITQFGAGGGSITAIGDTLNVTGSWDQGDIAINVEAVSELPAIPEPSATILAVLSSLGLAFRRSRR